MVIIVFKLRVRYGVDIKEKRCAGVLVLEHDGKIRCVGILGYDRKTDKKKI